MTGCAAVACVREVAATMSTSAGDVVAVRQSPRQKKRRQSWSSNAQSRRSSEDEDTKATVEFNSFTASVSSSVRSQGGLTSTLRAKCASQQLGDWLATVEALGGRLPGRAKASHTPVLAREYLLERERALARDLYAT
eukprot:COSAG06_NODE_5296_length_3579_cov_5.150862_2_plen_137_part_00